VNDNLNNIKISKYQILQLVLIFTVLFAAAACGNGGGITSVAREYEALSYDIESLDCTPNPVATGQNSVSFNYTLKNDVNELKIKIYAADGGFVTNIENLPIKKSATPYSNITWNLTDFRGASVSNGQYIYKLIYKKGENEYYKQAKLSVQR